MMDRAIELASDHGIGPVALRNANHWMRGGSYGWQAAEKGYIGICWTNSIAVMPPWGRKSAVSVPTADRRHPVYADHDGRYVDVDVLLRNVRS